MDIKNGHFIPTTEEERLFGLDHEAAWPFEKAEDLLKAVLDARQKYVNMDTSHLPQGAERSRWESEKQVGLSRAADMIDLITPYVTVGFGDEVERMLRQGFEED
jgi:hypothetical protein